MQLLYLWIEDYKNIKQQGFNFSPLYDFHFEPTDFDEDKKVIGGTLTDNIKDEERKKKADFYEDFFGKGISNVTAIVGENGAGKSSVLEMLNKISVKKSLNLKCLCIVRDFKNNYFIYKSKFTTIHPSHRFDGFYTIEDFENPDFYLPLNIISYSYQMKNFEVYKNYVQNKEKLETFIDISSNSLIYNIVNDNTENILTNFEVQKIYDQCSFLCKFETPFFKINSIQLQLKSLIFTNQNIDTQHKAYARAYYKNVKEGIQSISNIQEFIEQFYKTVYVKIVNTFTRFDFYRRLQQVKQDNKDGYFKNLLKNIRDVKEIISNNSKDDLTRFENIITQISNYCENNDIDVTLDFLLLTKEHVNIKSLLQQAIFNDDGSISFTFKDNRFSLFFEKYIDFFKIFDFNFDKEGNIQYLSQGEDAILFQLACFTKALKNIEYLDHQNYEPAKFKEPYYILIDEGELGLHPQWQKQYLKILLETLPKIFPDKEIQLILTSHSPFLVSDLPKENVIFLEKEKDTGECKVSKLDSMKETFGANIHTLLTDSFFMKGGLVGEFAQSKIDEAVDILNETEPKPEDLNKCEMIISMIGEPIVKNMLQKLLDSKRLRKVDINSSEIKKMTEELEELKKWKKLKEEEDAKE